MTLESGWEMRRAVLVGSLVAVLGLVLFAIALIPVTRVDEVVNATFTVNPGTKYGPYDAGTTYHTRVLIMKSSLICEVSVEGEGLYLTVNGYNTQSLQGVYVKGAKNFVIEPADDLYTFMFDNSTGSAVSVVMFRLEEVWVASLSPAAWLLGLFGLLIMVPAGLTTVVVARFRPPSAKTSSGNHVRKTRPRSNPPLQQL